ncbi:hypothetical protein [Marinicrinis lubricantis]|uniref:Uncharacterized protein n=1 Tax=Marinicrinis lubricantis TaxID=2086470 RepID=A0ABW1IJ87_9BACL
MAKYNNYNSNPNKPNRMNMIIMRILSVVIFIILISCSNKTFTLESDVHHLKLLNWDGTGSIKTISNQAVIKDLIQCLENSKSKSTASMDFPNPHWRLSFLDESGKTIIELGYFQEEVELGVSGHYWDPEKDIVYGCNYNLIYPF